MDDEWKYGLVFFALVACIALGIVLFKSYHESRVFNKLTGAETTTIDALFIQLRVVEPVELSK